MLEFCPFVIFLSCFLASIYLTARARNFTEFKPPDVETGFIDLSTISIFHKLVNIREKVIKEPFEEELTQPFQGKRGEFYIEQNEVPAKISYVGELNNYSNHQISVGDEVSIYGALVDSSVFITEAPYISLKLRAFSRIEKVVT